jgi:glutathionylspermidine synthase
MRRIALQPRHDWQSTAEQHGFVFHSPNGETYWDESAAYAFTLRQIEDDLEAPAAELEQMCFAVVDRVCRDDGLMERLAIPATLRDHVAASWHAKERNLYGRIDFAYDGKGPAKLYEYNADTPTSLYEAAVFQWVWLEQATERKLIRGGADQFNSLHERLVEAFARMDVAGPLHLAAVRASAEDQGTIGYLADCAGQAGLAASTMAIEDIGISTCGRFTDTSDRLITTLFKLYPWEWLMRESFARHIPGSGCRVIEPAWKSILSNKGLLALLWEMFPGHPNLLPACFAGDPKASDMPSTVVRKPLLSREGANIEIVRDGRRVGGNASGPYGAEGHVLQAYHPLPEFGGNHPVCGVWLVASEPAGMGIREDAGGITTDAARFVPHMIAA